LLRQKCDVALSPERGWSLCTQTKGKSKNYERLKRKLPNAITFKEVLELNPGVVSVFIFGGQYC